MAGRVQRDEPPAIPLHRLPVRQPPVGVEGMVAALAALTGRGQVRSEAERLRPRRRHQRRDARRVVPVRVRDEDPRHPLPLHRAQDRVPVRLVGRPRVQHRHLPPPDEIGVGAAVGEGPGVAAEDPPHPRRHRLHRPGHQGVVAPEIRTILILPCLAAVSAAARILAPQDEEPRAHDQRAARQHREARRLAPDHPAQQPRPEQPRVGVGAERGNLRAGEGLGDQHLPRRPRSAPPAPAARGRPSPA